MDLTYKLDTLGLQQVSTKQEEHCHRELKEIDLSGEVEVAWSYGLRNSLGFGLVSLFLSRI